jgi:hypothetical protein
MPSPRATSNLPLAGCLAMPHVDVRRTLDEQRSSAKHDARLSSVNAFDASIRSRHVLATTRHECIDGPVLTAALQEQHLCSEIAGHDSVPESCAEVHDSRSTESQPTGRGDAAMAAKKRGGSKRSAGKSSARRGGAKRGAKRASAKKGGAKKSAKKAGAKRAAAARKGAAKKAARAAGVRRLARKRAVKKAVVKKAVVKKAVVKKAATKRAGAKRKSSPLARVKRVATGVVEQAQSAVTHGVEAVKELGENIVERVSG